MPQIINETNWGGNIGAALGSGLSSGIQHLAQTKLNQITERNKQNKTASALEEMGVSKKQAYNIAGAPKELQLQYLKNISNERQGEALARAYGLLGENIGQRENAVNNIQSIGANRASQESYENNNLFEETPINLRELRQNKLGNEPGQQSVRNGLTLEQAKSIGPNSYKDLAKQQIEGKRFQANYNQKERSLELAEDREERAKTDSISKNTRAEEKQTKDFSKDAREYLKPFTEKARASRNNIRDYKTLSKLSDSGKLRSGNATQALSALGLGGFNRNYSTELADKLVARLAQNAASVFPRLTNFLESTYQKSLPTLWNTAAGLKGIAEMGLRTEQGNLLIEKAAMDVVKENDGKIPFDIDQQVEDRTRDEIDKLDKDAMSVALKGSGVSGSTNQKSQTFASLPSASKWFSEKGSRSIRDKVTGRVYRTEDGKSWKAIS